MKEIIELADRFKRERINCRLTQQELADIAAVSKKTVSSLERGNAITTVNLFKILKALGHGERFLDLVPEPLPSPILLKKLQGKEPQRVRK